MSFTYKDLWNMRHDEALKRRVVARADWADAYTYAVETGVDSPGDNPGVINDGMILAAVQAELPRLRDVAAKELRRLLGSHSAADAGRNAVLSGEVDPPADGTLPAGRDWAAELRVGIHAHPSMNHLHVHVLSRDMHSPCLKHRKHYNSFNTPFLIDVADFPLAGSCLEAAAWQLMVLRQARSQLA